MSPNSTSSDFSWCHIFCIKDHKAGSEPGLVIQVEQPEGAGLHPSEGHGQMQF